MLGEQNGRAIPADVSFWSCAIALAVTLLLAPPISAGPEVASSIELGPPPRLAGLPDTTSGLPAPEGVAADSATALSVNTASRSEVLAFFNTVYLASQGVAIGWTGSHAGCEAGATSQAYADATLLRVNYFRAMAGLPASVVLDDTLNAKDQSAALMMSAQGALSHTPDTGWACYTAPGAEAAGKSNLALGVSGPEAITGFIDDSGVNNYFVGHRRWILYPRQVSMGTGSVPPASGKLAANALWVLAPFGPAVTLPDGVAWPPRGYVPYQVLPQSGRWSLSYASANFSSATVTMAGGGGSVPVTLETQVNDVGYADNTLVWRPQGIPSGAPAADTTYSVTIHNVVIGGVSQDFSYEVTVFDPAQPATFLLGVTRAGAGTGSVLSSPAGIDCGTDCSQAYSSGTSVTLTATAAAGSIFTGWSGGGCSGTGSCTVSVTSATTVTATFAPGFALLVVRAGSGSGSVSSAPSGITCGATCSATFAQGTVVTLTATAAADSLFTGWSGGGCSGAGTCAVSVDAATVVTATFTLRPPVLTVSKAGTGTGTVVSAPAGLSCGVSCAAEFASGTTVTLTATPGTDSAFAGWSGGGCTGTGPCTVVLTADTTVTASFTRTFLLAVAVSGSGSGTISGSPAGISCGSQCSAVHVEGTVVTLTAVAAAGSLFAGWQGACAGAVPTCSVTMSVARSVSGTFSKVFSDPTLSAGETVIKAVHIADLRSAIDTLRTRLGLVAFTWTDPTLVPGTSGVRRLHIVELRTAVDQTYQHVGSVAPTYTDPAITGGSTLVRAIHLTELRSAVRGLE